MNISFWPIKNKKSLLLCFLVVMSIVSLLLLQFFRWHKSNDRIVAFVNGQSITTKEINYWMSLHKAEVYNYFLQNKESLDDNNFWQPTESDSSPLETLKKLAFKDAVRCKVQQELALKRGIIITTSYDDLMREIQEVNQSRKQMIDEGHPVYGPVEFNTRTYLDYVFDRITVELKNNLSYNELQLKESEFKKMSESFNQSSDEIRGFLQMYYVDQNYNSFIDELVASADIDISSRAYNKIRIE